MFQLLPKIHPLFPMFSALSLPCLPPLFLREDNIAQGAIKINLLVDKLLETLERKAKNPEVLWKDLDQIKSLKQEFTKVFLKLVR